MKYLNQIKSLINSPKLFIIWIFVILFFSQAHKIDTKILNSGEGYFVKRNIQEAQRAQKNGFIDFEVNDYAEYFNLPWERKKFGLRQIIRSGTEDFDDIGYAILIQTMAILGIDINIHRLGQIHNFAILISLILLCCSLSYYFNKPIYGLCSFVIGILLQSNMLSFIYGTPENRTFILFVPFLLFSLFIFTAAFKKYNHPKLLFLTLVILGCVVSSVNLIRYAEGQIAFFATIPFILLALKSNLKEKIRNIILFFLGAGFIYLIPSFVSIHRDIKENTFKKENLAIYFDLPKRHPTWHSLLCGIGRFPNKLGIHYFDIDLYKLAKKHNPESVTWGDRTIVIDGKERYEEYWVQLAGYQYTIRDIYFKYILENPREYFIGNIWRGIKEMFLVIPYMIEWGNEKRYYGYLPHINSIKYDKEDLSPYYFRVMNLKLRYSPKLQRIFPLYVMFIALILFIYLKTFKHPNKERKNLILALSLYFITQMGIRILVPVHGITLPFTATAFVVFLIFTFIEDRKYYLNMNFKMKFFPKVSTQAN